MTRGQCRGCGASVLWIKTAAGKSMIADPDIFIMTSEAMSLGKTIITENGITIRNPAVGISGYVPHWITCKNAKDFKRS